jgi:uncharacterized protein (DUF169 family)
MTTLSEYNSYGEEIQKRLFLRTFPIAIKLLEEKEDIPEAATRPKRDLGFHLGLCQGFAMSRREGATVAFMKEDHWCYVPIIALGIAEPPEYVLEGNVEYPERISNLETAKNVAKNAVHLEYGRYAGIVSAPLKSTTFEPDLVIIYCDSAQLRSLLSGMKYKDGYVVTTALEPGGACIQSTVPVIRSGECKVSVPCMGDRMVGLAQDDEMIFSVPKGKLGDLMIGIRHFHEAGLGFPIKFTVRPDYQMMPKYKKVGKMIGMDIPKL